MDKKVKRSNISRLRESLAFLPYLGEWMPLAFFVGVCCGLVMMAFYFSLLLLQNIFAYVPIYLSMIIGALVTALFLRFGRKEIQGSGIPNYIHCRKGEGDIGLKDVGSKFLASASAIGSGCIAGKEGPAIFMGGGIASFWARLLRFPVDKRNMTVTIGGAAATSAIFQAPLGGTIFAIEIPYRHDVDAPEYMPAFLSSLISYFVFRYGIKLISGEVPRLLDLPITSFPITPRHILYALIVGVITGLVGVLFVKTFHYLRQNIAPRFKSEVSAMVGVGLAAFVSFLALIVIKESIPFGGTGFNILNYIPSHPNLDVNFLLIILAATLLASSLTVGMGVSGGVFGPALVIGGCVGGIFGLLVDPVNVSAYMVIGMSASHTASTKTPIASLVLIMEMTGFPPVFIAMAVANIAAFFISGEKSLYHGQMRDRFEALVQKLDELDVLSALKVKDIMQKDVLCLREKQSVLEAKELFTETGKHTIPVLGPKKIVHGVLTVDDIRGEEDDTLIDEIMVKEPMMLDPEKSLKEALYFFNDQDIDRAPVISEKGELLGFFTLRDIIRTHRKYIAEHHLLVEK
jgi:CIC family chloride channel protein